MIAIIVRVLEELRSRAALEEDDGYSTAELLANAALAIGALVTIWAAMGGMGQDVITWIQTQLTT